MNAFHERFQPDPDPDMSDFRRLWRTEKPLLREAIVSHAPPYPHYSKLKLERKQPSCDPSCPSARDVSDCVEVVMYSSAGNGFCEIQEQSWHFLLENTAILETNLRRKLFAQHKKALQQFLDEDLPTDRRTQNYWKKIQDDIDWNDATAVDHLYKLVRIGLVDDGLDDCGFSSFEFQTGWDLDHGTAILMHKENVLAASGMEELVAHGSNIVQAVKNVQAYDLDHGDLPLQGT